jgi:eukaryotic-like serine/threonine-protein kinase
MTSDPVASNEPPPQSAGATLREGRYRLRQKLGQGGMGSVYLAEDTLLPGRLVAIKENLAASDDAQGQFKREALLLARLRHPNLPQVMDYFIETDGKQYLVMDYVPGENLAQILKQRQGPLPVSEALAIVEQVMLALGYMHTWCDPDSGKLRPIIHRDIKPANIKRTPEGRVVLVDFGIAKMDSGTMTGTALSAKALTPGYAPLEQYGGGTDARSDIYSLGATLFALLAGKAPPSATDMAMAGSKQKAPLMGAIKSAPPAVVKVIERAMQSMPEARYQSMAEMYQALYNRPLPAGGGVNMAAAQPGPAGKRGRWTAVATAVGAILLVGGGWLLATQFAGVPPAAPTAVVPVDTPTAEAAAMVVVTESPVPTASSMPEPTAI